MLYTNITLQKLIDAVKQIVHWNNFWQIFQNSVFGLVWLNSCDFLNCSTDSWVPSAKDKNLQQTSMKILFLCGIIKHLCGS